MHVIRPASVIYAVTVSPSISMPNCSTLHGDSSHCRKRNAIHSPSATPRIFAATRCSVTSARKASATGANNSTSVRKRLRGPNQWPESLPEMRTTTLAWMAAIEPVGLTVMRALAVGLGQSLDAFDDAMLPHGDVHVKIIRYPTQIPGQDTGQGVGMHHDSGVLTFILQDDTGGLEVQTDAGIVPAINKPGCYVMNLGEMLQSATNGYLRATPHRVVSPSTGQARISIAFFAHPRLESRFEPIELPAELAALARGAENPDPDDPVFSTFGANCLKIRLRAHPDVAQRFYSEGSA
jgi:isopenicillin N synthase-like dioxygenase